MRLLNYSKWKLLLESEQSNKKIFFSVAVLKSTAIPSYSHSSKDRIDWALEKIEKLFPGSKLENATAAPGSRLHKNYLKLTIPQDKFENFEGEFEPLVLDSHEINQELGKMTNDSRSPGFPNEVTSWLKKNSKEVSFRRDANDKLGSFSKKEIMECILNDEFLDYTKEQLIERISSEILKSNCVDVSDEDISSEIETAMLSQASGGIAGKPSEIIAPLIVRLLTCDDAETAINAFKSTDSFFQIIDLNEIEQSLNQRVSKVLVDYSNLSEPKKDQIIKETDELLKYLSHTVKKFGKEANRIAMNFAFNILDHIDQHVSIVSGRHTLTTCIRSITSSTYLR